MTKQRPPHNDGPEHYCPECKKPEQICTDEDLDRYKQWLLNDLNGEGGAVEWSDQDTQRLLAILARLEAGEDIIHCYIAKELSDLEGPDRETHNKNVDDFFKALGLWRKRCGK
jgi:hypothetical protein